jgi:hypothetical protein
MKRRGILPWKLERAEGLIVDVIVERGAREYDVIDTRIGREERRRESERLNCGMDPVTRNPGV